MSDIRARVKNLFVKPGHRVAMVATENLQLRKGFGIEGDINSDCMSPRQILVTRVRDLEQLSIAPAELRENIVLDVADSSVFEPGAKLTFASGAAIRLTFYCEPCRQVAHLVDSLETLNRKRGILGVIVTDGAIALSDRVSIEPDHYPALSEKPYQRFLDFIARVPYGKIVTYKQVLRCIGVDRSYFRAIPIYIKKAPQSYPVHRVLDSQGCVLSHIPQQQELLEAEGVRVDRATKNSKPSVLLSKYAWHDPGIYENEQPFTPSL